MDDIPFTQKFLGAVLVAVVGGLIVHVVTQGPRFASLEPSSVPSSSSEQVPSNSEGIFESKSDDHTTDRKINPDENAQRQTVSDSRNIGTAMFSWLTDEVGAAAAGQSQVEGAISQVDLKGIPQVTHKELYKILVPRYMQSLPKRDGWGHYYEFYLNVEDPMAKQVMGVRSPGRDGIFSDTNYSVGPVDPEDFDEDIVWSDGFFVQWPNLQKDKKN